MGLTSIEWADRTWNPTRGCSRVSQGCLHCYAETLAGRYSAFGANPDSPFAGFVTKVNGHASWTGKVELIESMLDAPLRWKTPCRVFVNSMSDLFHEALPDEAIDRVFAVMALCPQHTFQILTKRPERMLKYLTENHGFDARRRVQDVLDPVSPAEDRLCNKEEGYRVAMALLNGSSWPLPNCWLGVSCEDFPTWDARAHLLKATPAAKRFISYEPALADLGSVDLEGIHWLIAGYESGSGARPAKEDWIRSIKDQCVAAGTAFFYKQSAIKGRKIGTPELDGRKWMQFPDEVRA